MIDKLRIFCVLLAVAFLDACGNGGGSSGVIPQQPSKAHFAVGPFTGTFTEYPFPAGQSFPGHPTVGPDGAVWFTYNQGVDRILSTGSITPFPAPALGGVSPNQAGPGLARANGFLWYYAQYPAAFEPVTALIRQSIDGTSSSNPVPDGEFFIGPFAGPGRDTLVDFRSLSGTQIDIFNVRTGESHTFDAGPCFGESATAGRDGNVYATVVGCADPLGHDAVLQLTPTGVRLNKFELPHGTGPGDIVAGPDGALWFTESGANKIARLTTSGSIREFPLPTPNAGAGSITVGSDGALWFTELLANAIGRITTTGTITEYPVPTAFAGPFGIASCPGSCEGAHGRLWFSEAYTFEIAKFEF